MLYFIVIYVALVIVAFTCFLISNRRKKEERKYYEASEKIINEDLLKYSLRNPYTRSSRDVLPSSRRMMLGVKISNGKNKKSMVFDPEKIVYIGRSDYNHIVIYNMRVSERHCCIFSKDNRVWLSDLSMKKGVIIKRNGKKGRIANGKTALLRDGDIVYIDNVKLKIKIFVFDINHK